MSTLGMFMSINTSVVNLLLKRDKYVIAVYSCISHDRIDTKKSKYILLFGLDAANDKYGIYFEYVSGFTNHQGSFVRLNSV